MSKKYNSTQPCYGFKTKYILILFKVMVRFIWAPVAMTLLRPLAPEVHT